MTEIKLRPYQERDISLLREGFKKHKAGILCQPTGCHAAGERVMRYSGCPASVESIKAGDLLMGPDSKPRTVLSLVNGFGRMNRVIPVKGEPFTANEDHVLSLRRTNDGTLLSGCMIDISVADYKRCSRTFKHIHKLFRVPVDFKPLPRSTIVSPRLLGILLGDGGLTQNVNVTTPDQEIIDYLHKEASRLGLLVSKDDRGPTRSQFNIVATNGRGPRKPNILLNELRKIGVWGHAAGTKFIPNEYKIASLDDRLELLAGLIDTDGHLAHGHIDYISKSPTLASDLAFVARSVGLAAYITPCIKGYGDTFKAEYFRVSISGDISRIPCHVPRRQADPRKQIKDVLCTGLKIEQTEDGEFFGFTLDGDGRYLLADFTVTHNSGKGTAAAYMIHRATSFGNRVLFVVFGAPLVIDMHERVTNLGIEAGMIMGSGTSATRKPWLPVQVASISTLWRRQNLPAASLVICDETQDITARTFREVLARYEASGSKILGLSATPIGPGGIGLGRNAGGIFDFMVTGPSVKELIRDKYLVSCRLYCFDCDSLKGVKKKGDDYDQNALAALAASNSHRVGDIVESWKNYASDRKTAAFGVDKADAMRIKEQFSVQGINATTIFDDTSPDDRKQMWKDFDHGDLRVISSVNVIGRGVDHSILKCVIDAAGTLSIQRTLQRWGRGSRPHPGYEDFILLDFCGNYYRHGSYSASRTWSLDGGPPKTYGDGEPDYRIKTCPKCRFPFKLGPKACPRCGHAIPIKEREVREANGHLKLIDIEEEQQEIREQEQQEQKRDAVADWAARATDEQKLAKLEEWKKKAKENGWKNSWAWNTYRRAFGAEPPRVRSDKLPPPPEIRDVLNNWETL